MSLDRPRALVRAVPLTALLFAAAFFCAHLAANTNANKHAHTHAASNTSAAPSSTEPNSAATISLSTDDRIDSSPGWWPTKSAASLKNFVGSSECAQCHTQIAATQQTTPMAQAATPAANSEILRAHADLTDQRAAYHYELATTPNTSNFTVTDGTQSISATIAWAFGLGHKGQTYIYERDGGFYESHLSFYKSLQALDLTTGHDATNPDDLKSAMGRWLDGDEARRCFGCHTTASRIAGNFDTSHLTPGVQCESCHGPGAAHVAAMKSGKIAQGRAAIFNPRRLDATASVDFCGACHRTWADVILGEAKLRPGAENVMNVRFQPYRLEDSKCWRNSAGDPRLQCTACHNPHEQLNTTAASYDAKCLTCHSGAPTSHASDTHAIAAAATNRAENSFANISDNSSSTPVNNSHATAQPKICPQSQSDCITCHMPQIEVPTVHATFFDHRIRIVHPDAPYPM